VWDERRGVVMAHYQHDLNLVKGRENLHDIGKGRAIQWAFYQGIAMTRNADFSRIRLFSVLTEGYGEQSALPHFATFKSLLVAS
jgi:hypothetical protein